MHPYIVASEPCNCGGHVLRVHVDNDADKKRVEDLINEGASRTPVRCPCGSPTLDPGPTHKTSCSLWKAGN